MVTIGCDTVAVCSTVCGRDTVICVCSLSRRSAARYCIFSVRERGSVQTKFENDPVVDFITSLLSQLIIFNE